MTRHLLTILDLAAGEIESLIARASALKRARAASGGAAGNESLRGKTLGLLFEKHSTRTRLSFEVAVLELGGHPIYIAPETTQISRGEPIQDTARVLSRYLHGIVIRTAAHERIAEFARFSTIPVINGLTDLFHPCQILSDLMTIREKRGSLEGLKVAWVGDGNNVAHSWIEASARLGFSLALACPAGYGPKPSVLARLAPAERARIQVTQDPREAVGGADAINTDVWVSMGQDGEKADRFAAFRGYQVNADLVSLAAPGALVMHCMPAHRGEEITEDVIEGPRSIVFDQAENRLHMQKAILEALVGAGAK